MKDAIKQKTFCNPLNLNYAYRIYEENGPICLEAADPIIVLFKDEYYLFSSVTEGYWFSEDLANWHFIECTEAQLPGINGYAPAAMVMDGYIYWHQGYYQVKTFRTNDPKNPDAWELVNAGCNLDHDPFIYYDETEDRVWGTYGCGDLNEQYIHVQEIDKKTMEPRGKIYNCIFADQKNRGWERPLDNHTVEGWGYTEGAQIFKYNNKWYLTYSGYSLNKCYATGVYTAQSPSEEFTYEPNNPVAHKNTGFIGSAAHGCFFQDKYKNWWIVTCASVNVSHAFERRINLYPAGIDEDGLLFTNTTLSDYPIELPTSSRNHVQSCIKGWMLLSKDKPATASSIASGPAINPLYGAVLSSTEVPDSKDDHRPCLAFDEDIRTLWSAASGNEGEWLKVDLETICTVNSVQVNFATYNVATTDSAKRYTQYKIEYSTDGKNWLMLTDKRENTSFVPHDYIELSEPVNARYLRITNKYVAGDGCFAISGFRIFGNANSEAPLAPEDFTLYRDETDGRNAFVKWESTQNAEGYIVKYGVAPDKLYNQYQIYGNMAEVRTLTKGISYYFSLDAFNQSSYTEGKVIKFIK
jgi:xylan 1,4-beta-xylosidase